MAKSPFLWCPRLCPRKCQEATLLHVLVGWGDTGDETRANGLVSK